MKPLSRKPFVLMLQDDAGELSHLRLDPGMVNSDTAIIVLDEYSDTCWVWIGRDVNMPTRMHALRMSKSVQKSGYTVGATTIGMSIAKLVEMMEKDDSDPDVASNITSFKEMIRRKWSFDDGVLAFDASQAKAFEAKPPDIVDSMSSSSPVHVQPKRHEAVEIVAETVDHEPKPVLTVTTPGITAEKKAAFLLYSAVKNADVVYVERFERNGIKGLKLEVPGSPPLVLEALLDGNDISISPDTFGDHDRSAEIKKTYEAWVKRL
ncbi:MAG: hypothetical protein ACFFED_05075 [Candidatus Thorarchaeota archaeon]